MTSPRRAVYPSGCITRTAAENLPHGKAFSLGEKVARYAPDEGKTSGWMPRKNFCCPVGRGDPTPPSSLPAGLNYRDATCRDAGCLKPALRPLRCFLSTPSAGRATAAPPPKNRARSYFYPRPPWGGRHIDTFGFIPGTGISIHALRGEGDLCSVPHLCPQHISIHALRGEGDHRPAVSNRPTSNFYPRPPWGGRP